MGQLVHGFHAATLAGEALPHAFDPSKDMQCIRGWTLYSGVSLVETLQAKGVTVSSTGQPLFGDVNALISYPWHVLGGSFNDLVAAMEFTLSKMGQPSEEVCFFMDVFSLSQHPPSLASTTTQARAIAASPLAAPTSAPPPPDQPSTTPPTDTPDAPPERDAALHADRMKEFESVIGHCSCVFLHATPIASPTAFTRLWCLYEVLLAKQSGVAVKLVLHPHDEFAFHQGVRNGLSFVSSLMESIDSLEATASVTDDINYIRNYIASSVGFGGLDDLLSDMIREWGALAFPSVVESACNNVAVSNNNNNNADNHNQLATHVLMGRVAKAFHRMESLGLAREWNERAIREAESSVGNLPNLVAQLQLTCVSMSRGIASSGRQAIEAPFRSPSRHG